MSSKYPTQMSCMDAFDQLTACFSLGGQFRHYYRYGSFNECLKDFDKFKFCLMYSKDPVKVQEWYRDQWKQNRESRGTSDDIWKERPNA